MLFLQFCSSQPRLKELPNEQLECALLESVTEVIIPIGVAVGVALALPCP